MYTIYLVYSAFTSTVSGIMLLSYCTVSILIVPAHLMLRSITKLYMRYILYCVLNDGRVGSTALD